VNVHFDLPKKSLPPGWLTIGSFDGVHRGHQKVIKRLVDAASRDGVPSTVMTFDPHPRCVLAPDTCPLSLTTVDEQAEAMADLGVDNLVVMPFTRKLSQLTATQFMAKVTRKIPLRGLVIGYDFALGHQRRGDRAFLEHYGDTHGFEVEVITPHSTEGKIISSSRLRELLLDGQVAHAARLLGRHYSTKSFVEHGTGTGSRIGYPTANFAITPNKLVPKHGVYAIWVDIDGQAYPGAMNIGYRPTFGGTTLTVEAFIFDFDRDIYQQTVRARFVQRIRDEKKFKSPEALVQQITKDVARARAILSR
jgi:riboflavin kinase/FMN adenylyltransferase